MHPDILAESTLQQHLIALLVKMGYTFIPREKATAMRGGKLGEVLLKEILLERLQVINGFTHKGVAYKFSPKNIASAIDELDIPLIEGLMSTNRKISERLILGTSFDEELSGGSIKSPSFYYIDFEHPENNVFHVTEEFAIDRRESGGSGQTRRPDLVLFINGIPLAVIELKRSSVEASEGIEQMIANQAENEIPHLFRYIQITLAGNNYTPLYGTVKTPEKFYSYWREEGLEETLQALLPERTLALIDQTVYALFSKQRFLELIHSYVFFDNGIKKVARYQQYFAIKKTMERLSRSDAAGRRAGGLIWHTQGSGKSLTMVLLTKIIKRAIPSAKIILVTDRTDLDEQLNDTFNQNDLKAVQANSGADLIEKLNAGTAILTTLIHKFAKVDKEKVVIENPDIFVLIDEAHRTQSEESDFTLHKAMKKTFPNGCYIGFTGTPLLSREKSSIALFHGIIDEYTIRQALKDNAVLPLYYEGRMVEQWINDDAGLDRRFEIISRHLSEEQKKDLQFKWARLKKVASSERRLEAIAADIEAHYTTHLKNTPFKAILAASSRYEAIRYHNIFQSLYDLETAFVISPSDARPKENGVDETESAKVVIASEWKKLMDIHSSEEAYIKSVKNRFLEGEIDLLIVVNKLLTGFDAPRAQVLYIDKMLREHGLLQAIARINRLDEGKDNGLIIDYRGLLGELDQALTNYAALEGYQEEEISKAVLDIREEIEKVKTYYSHLEGLFKEVKHRENSESYQVYLADKEKRKQFYDLLSHYARALRLSLSSDKINTVFSREEIQNYKKKMKFYAELRKSIQHRYGEKVDFGKYEKQMQKLLDVFISAKEVNRLTELIGIFDEGFDKELDRLGSNNARADAILHATSKVITEKYTLNPAFYEKLSLKIREILEAYKAGRLSDEEKIKQAKEIRKTLERGVEDPQATYPESINSEVARALYDNLPQQMKDLENNVVAGFVLECVDFFNAASKKPDWEHNTDIKNRLEQQIDDALCNIEEEHGIQFDSIQETISQIRSIGMKHYEKR